MKLFDIGKRIRELRKEQGLRQEELAQRADISRVTLGKLERGQMGLEKRYILLSAIGILFVRMRQEVKELQVKKTNHSRS